MDKIKAFIKKISTRASSLINEIVEERLHLDFPVNLFRLIYVSLAVVSLVMSIVNVITGKHLLLLFTLGFAILCFINAFLSILNKTCQKISRYLFDVELIALIVCFIITGTPEGFSAIWAIIIPMSGLLLWGLKRGILMSTLMFVILVFFLWLPWGQSLLMYQYTESFKLRFPFLYLASFAISVLLTFIIETLQSKEAYTSTHDTLTGALNRQGFSNQINKLKGADSDSPAIFIILDLDHFKKINDTYGHYAGDDMLKQISKRIEEEFESPVCRWGGEEFAIFTENNFTFEDIEKRRNAIGSVPFKIKNRHTDEVLTLYQTVSAGAVRISRTCGISPLAASHKADLLLYAAKEGGRNKLCYKDEITGETNHDL